MELYTQIFFIAQSKVVGSFSQQQVMIYFVFKENTETIPENIITAKQDTHFTYKMEFVKKMS